MIAFFCLALLGIGCGYYWLRKKAARLMILILLAAVLGFQWAYWHARKKLAWSMPVSDIQIPLEVTGKVVGIPQLSSSGLRFDLQITHYNHQAINLEVKIRLFWQNPTKTLSEGDSLQAQVQLKPPWHLANPGSFDLEKQFFIEGIRATGRLLNLQNYQPNPHFNLNRLRQELNNRMSLLLAEKPFLGVIQATTLGLYQNISPEQWQVFQVTGTSHAIAISGLHISLIALLCFKGMSFLSRRSRYLMLGWPAQCYGAVAAILGALFYAAIAGFSIPTQRSLIMITVAMGSILCRQPMLTWHGLALAWLGIALIDPLAPLQLGFWLSFISVAALIYANHSSLSGKSWQQWLRPQWVAFLAILPLTVLFFAQISWLAPLANLLVLPLMNIIVVPASLIALILIPIAPVLAKGALWLAHSALVGVWWVLAKIAQLTWGVSYPGSVPFLYIMSALLGVVFLLAPKGLPAKYLGGLSVAALLIYARPALKPGECYFTLLDVGQGLAAVLQTQHHVLIYDAGPQYGESADAGKRIIIPYLNTLGIRAIDKVVISHSDLDHRGGLASFRSLAIADIVSSEPQRLNVPARLCQAGESWEWDGVRFTFLHPIETYQRRNDLSCVLKVQTRYHSILLTGDIEKTAEKKLIQQYGQALKSAILVVPHHGSLTSSSEDFIAQVSPRYALYPVGMLNQYGFPKLPVLHRYAQHGAINLRVSHTGALIFHLKNEPHLTAPIQWRDTARHYWHRVLSQEE